MNDIRIIAWREFLQYIRTRGFILTLFFIPAWFILGGVVQQLVAETTSVRYFAVVDESGSFAAAIDRTLEADRQRAIFEGLVAWARANVDIAALSRHAPAVAKLLNQDGGDPATIARFVAAGGAGAVVAAVVPDLRPGAADFVPPRANLLRIDPSPDIVAAAKAHDRSALLPVLKGETPVATADGRVPLFALAVIPADFSATAPGFEYWCENQTDPVVQDFLRRALADELRLQTAAELGLAPASIHRLLDATVTVDRFNPSNAAGNGAVSQDDILRIVLPFGIALLLLVAILSISSMLLMAVIEEKSSRVIEMILASTSAERVMAGKLIGAAGAALILMAGWILGGGGAASLLTHSSPGGIVAALVRAHAFGDMPAVAICFVCGLAIHTTIFLGVGAMARSFQEAQSYLGPLLFILFAPIGFVTVVFNEPNGALATLLSFSPLHAPFFLMMRLPNSPPPIGTALAFLWMIVCTVAIVRLMIWGFVSNILRSEPSPGWRMLGHRLARIWRRPA